MKLEILNTKQIKEIKNLIKEQWGCDFRTELAFLLSSKSKVYLVNRDIARIESSKLRIEVIGLYFGELKNEELRLSIEGSQMIGPLAKKNVVELDERESRTWLKGYDLEKEARAEGFAILKYDNDFLGTGKVKDKKILNFVPKNRRILSD